MAQSIKGQTKRPTQHTLREGQGSKLQQLADCQHCNPAINIRKKNKTISMYYICINRLLFINIEKFLFYR